MTENFDRIIERRGTDSVKWDAMDGSGIPMWVSDVDFAAPPAVLAALHQRADHGVFGYSTRNQAYDDALLAWFAGRHNLTLDPQWICCVEGVVPGLALLLQMLSQPGDGVVVQGPYYGSFAKIITLNGRALLENPLSECPQFGYRMDLDQLEQLFHRHRPPLMILCNPHNPTGRCWSADELTRLLTLCERYDVTLLSDEIWADLLLPGNRFTSVLHLDSRWHRRIIAATAPSKTFGLSSLRLSNFLIPDATLRQRFLQRLDAHGLDVFNAMSLTASTAALRHGAGWLDELLAYLAENRRWFCEQATQHLPWARITPAQGTYLLWVDCRALGLDDDTLKQRIIEQAGIVPSMGASFGPTGQGFIRLNLGCPRRYLEQALAGLRQIQPA
jgi:cystathionine beta-lyase